MAASYNRMASQPQAGVVVHESAPTMNVMYLCSAHISMNPVHVFKSTTMTSFAQKSLPMVFCVAHVRASPSDEVNSLTDDSSAMCRIKTVQFNTMEDAAMFGKSFNTSASAAGGTQSAPAVGSVLSQSSDAETLQKLRGLCASNTNEQFCRIVPAFVKSLPVLSVVHNTTATRIAAHRMRFAGVDGTEDPGVLANSEFELIICESIERASLTRRILYEPRIVAQHMQLENEVGALQHEVRAMELEAKFRTEDGDDDDDGGSVGDAGGHETQFNLV